MVRNHNGKLLALAVENNFDAFVTADRNLSYQQNITAVAIRIIVLEAQGIQLRHTLPLMEKVLAVLNVAVPASVIRVS